MVLSQAESMTKIVDEKKVIDTLKENFRSGKIVRRREANSQDNAVNK